MGPASIASLSGSERFQSLWQRNLLPSANDASRDIHQLLIDAYAEPQRRYHTLEHIEHCLAMFEDCRSLVHNPDALELAVWFHDAIFEPGNPANEALSAELYLRLSEQVHPEPMRALIARMIMATLHDGSSLEDADSVYMVDIDLSSFGLSYEDFLRDSQNLRDENPTVTDEEYFHRKKAFQEQLLARPRFFLSDYFYQRYEQQARKNLSRYQQFLQQQ